MALNLFVMDIIDEFTCQYYKRLSDLQWKNELLKLLEYYFDCFTRWNYFWRARYRWVQKDYMDIAFKEVELNLMRNIKKVFDPKNIMNPSKIF